MLKDALFSEDRKYRYYLKRIWDENLPYAMVIGLNPSTANEEDDDTTIQNLIKLLSGSGYGRTPNGRPLHPLAATIWQRTKCKIQKYA